MTRRRVKQTLITRLGMIVTEGGKDRNGQKKSIKLAEILPPDPAKFQPFDIVLAWRAVAK